MAQHQQQYKKINNSVILAQSFGALKQTTKDLGIVPLFSPSLSMLISLLFFYYFFWILLRISS
jgi:hypothetical protein